MSMNRAHAWLCSSNVWAGVVKHKMLPWVLQGIDFGPSVLEIGPGYGATTRVLADQVPSLTALEIDRMLFARLESELGGRVRLVLGDGTAMPFPDGGFSSVVCFTMLHHVPSRALQDRLFAEALRVLRPGGLFAGSDSVTSVGFRMLHLFDTMVAVDPDTLGERLGRIGFVDVEVKVSPRRVFKFWAKKPS